MIKALDLQVQCTTKWGPLIDPVMAKQIGQYLGVDLNYDQTDDEMAAVFTKANVKSMVIIPTMIIKDDIGKVRDLNDKAANLQKTHPDAIAGIWASIHPNLGWKGLRELERCIKDLGFVGYYMGSLFSECPIDDKIMWNFHDLCSDAGVPVRWNVGHTAAGAGQPGGGGYLLKYEKPFPYLDEAAAKFPKLTFITAHCAWPWQSELISILIHKGNVYFENHGWAPKHVPLEIKNEIRTRLLNKAMFASDWPFFEYDRIFKEWESEEGFTPKVLEKMYLTNAQKIFKNVKL